jgi:hypothetical protein
MKPEPVDRLIERDPGAETEARYTISHGSRLDVHVHFHDLVGDNALLILTPAKVRQLIADLTPFAAPARKAKPRRKR